jgi:hypothetical protein
LIWINHAPYLLRNASGCEVREAGEGQRQFLVAHGTGHNRQAKIGPRSEGGHDGVEGLVTDVDERAGSAQ